MAIGWVIISCTLIAQAISAPSGCIESCNFFQTSIHKTSSGYQDHANLVQTGTNLNDHDYAKPGNWTEHNQYSTDDGHGKVHEERGQYVEGSKKVRFYKKNFTASYGNVNGLDATELGKSSSQHRYDSIHVPSNQYTDSQSAYNLGQTITKETGYDRIHSQQAQSSLSTRIDSKSERLEDFGEYSGHSQVNQHFPDINTQTSDTQHHVETTPDNWSRTDSYKTDGGRGHVFEEEGQYVTGPKKVRYYKKNYTSSYSSSVPQSNIGSATLDELHTELQRNLHKDLDSLRRNFHQASSTGHTAATTHVGSTTGLTQEAVGFHDLQTAESDYRQHLGYRGIPTTGNVHTELQRETLIDTRQLPSIRPTAVVDTYGTESHRTYQSHETHMPQVQPMPQSSHLSPGYRQVPRPSGYQTSYHNAHSSGHHLNEAHRTETLGTHQASRLQNQLLTEESQRVHNPHSSHVTYPSRHGETRHYEEHWRSSSHTGGSVVPERTIAGHSEHGVGHTERAHYDRDAYNEHRGRYHTAQGYESRARTSGSSYDSTHGTSSGQLVAGSLNLGHAGHGADCTEETHQQYQQHETRYHRKYKRDAHHGNVQEHQAIDGDFTQQNQEFGQESQQLEDLTQQSERFTQQTQESDDLTQQTSGKLELGQQTIDNQHLDDLTQQSEQFTQQTEGQLEFGQQIVGNPHLEDLTRQTEGQIEFGQQTVDNPHPKDLTQQSEQFTQQTQGLDDLTQQTSGKLEFDQQTVGNPHLEDLTQKTEGQIEFGQQTVGNPYSEDLTQQSEQFTQQTQRLDDLTQQTSGKLEFGQQTVSNPHLENLTQQTEGQIEFGQQTVDNPHPKDLTQQSEQFTQQTQGLDDLTQQTSGKLEFGQQTVGNPHLEDLTQKTEGQIEFGQQTVGNPYSEDLTQQSEQFTQHTQGLDDLTQQTSGKLEFGRQAIDNHHLDDLTQQSEQFTQQKEGPLEFGQQTLDNPHLEDLTQQTQESGDFTQQKSGKLEYGQQTIDNQHLEDIMQQTQGSDDDITQQTSGKLEFAQQTDHTQQLEQFAQHRSDSLTQQTQLDKHEFGQHVVGDKHLDDLTQQSEQFSQQTEGQLEFGQQIQVGNQHLEDSTRQNEQFAQQTDDYTQQSLGKLEFGQQTQPIDKSAKPKSQRLEEFNEQNEDFTQQTRFDDFTQQTGHLEFGQLQQPHRFSKPKGSSHHSEDFTQQNEDIIQQTGGFDDFSQQTAGHLEYGQQREQQQKRNWPDHNTQRLEHYSQQNEWDIDLPQQSQQYSSYNDKNNKQSEWQLEQMSEKTNQFDQGLTQQTDRLATGVKPAPKPKPRPRYQKHESIPRTDETDTIDDDVFKPVEVNPEADIDNFGRIIESGSRATYPESNRQISKVLYSSQGSGVFDNQKENMDRLHWVHKSNDATVGLQWHYTYHPSDLTNVESSHDNYYPRHNVDSMSQQTEDTQQQSKSFDFDQQETQDKDTLDDKHKNPYISQSSQQDRYNRQSFQQTEPSRFDNQLPTFNQNSDQNPSRVIPLQRNENSQLTLEQEKQSTPTTEQTEDKVESRILQAYGGGPYDAPHSDDFYNRVRPNPSATLPPMDGDDSWDIREKPRVSVIPRTWPTVRVIPEIVTTTEVVETTTQAMETTTQPSFWSRVGHKITSTYDKAKEKAKEIFG